MTTDLDKAVERQPFMPTCEISPDALVRVESGEVITWAECQRRLSSANARAKAAEEGLLHPWAHGDKLFYDMDGVPIRVTYFGNDEGWAAVTFDADDPNSGPIAVRPSRLSARATLAKLEVRG